VILVVLDLAEHVEEEDAHVVVEVLVVQEELREERQVLAVDWVFITVHLENGHFALLIAVDLISGGVEEGADLAVLTQFNFQCEEAETEIAGVEAVEVVVVDRIGAEVPGFGGMPAELYPVDGLELGDFLVCEQFGVVHTEMGVVVGVHVGVGFIGGGVLDAVAGLADAGTG
jgi:hypothetical protein